MIYNSLQSEQPNCDFPITTHKQPVFHLGPYHNELTASRPICAVKHCRAESVVRWGTTREYSGAPGIFGCHEKPFFFNIHKSASTWVCSVESIFQLQGLRFTVV